jgi:Family of unknown function (DUF6866) N-terminal domain/Family of unknown function (DUF6866) C-terminal domain
MTDLQKIFSQVKRNCNISDAKYWGTYSLCGLLMRLRELYGIENGIRPWEKIDQKDIGDWITARENLWRELEDKDYENISVNGNSFSPFEVENMNAVLNKSGLMYGAGFGIYMKPSFFIADVLSQRKVNGFDIYIAGSEYARDLSDNPAMLQGNTIIARVDLTRLLLWGRFIELRNRKTNCNLAYAFSKYGITCQEEPSEDTIVKFSDIAYSEAETYVYHELGEAYEGRRLGDEWKTFLTCLQRSKAEIFARSVKDVLADTSGYGMLNYIIENRKEGSLGFYNVFLSGFRKTIFPEMPEAFRIFVESGNWKHIEQAKKAGYKKSREYAEQLLSVYQKNKSHPELISKQIEEEIMNGIQ